MHFFYFKSLKIHYNLKVDFFPKSMRRLYGFGDVLLTHTSESGVLLIKHKPQAHPCFGSICDTTVKFCDDLSVFLVSTCQSLKIGSTFIVGLILTVAHVVSDT